MTDIESAAAQAVLTVDLEALKANWRLLAGKVAPAECGAVVKADAYGLGIADAVPALARAGCRTFFVAHLSEGRRTRTAVRQAGFPDAAIDVYLLHGLQPGALIHPDLFDFRLNPILASMPEIEVWAAETAAFADRPTTAIQIDTGMNRIGLAPRETASISKDLLASCGATLLLSHFVAAEEPRHPANAAQISAFDQARSQSFLGLRASMGNSSGLFLPQRPHYDLVRPGYALYGGNPCPGLENPMRSVVTLRAAILQTRWIEAGETVGYNGRWVAKRPTRLATIGVGYADGVPRGARTVGLGDGPRAKVGDTLCPWVGRVSMDLSIVDVTDAEPAASQPGAWVELIGAATSVDQFGAETGTIGYEILTCLGRRYHRAYVEAPA